MLLFEQFEQNGYKKAGNWFIHSNISVNLFTKEMKSTNCKVIFSYNFKKEVDIDTVEKARTFLDSLD